MIAVTGAAGFIGSQIALNLAKNKEKLLLVDRMVAFHERKYTPASNQIQFIEADGPFFDWLKTDSAKDLSCIIHMGAITNTAETDLKALAKWNVDYTKNLWKFCQEQNVNFIYASSAATYGDGTAGFGDDPQSTAVLKPLNAYGRSKQEFDLFALAQSKTPPHWYGVKYFNVYGPNEFHKGRMASAVWHGYNEIKKTGAMTLFKSHNPQVNDGDQARDFIFISDVLQIIDFLNEKKPENGIYNVGTGHAGTFKNLAEALFGALKQPMKINWVETPTEFRAAYQYRTEAQVDKLRAAGWTKDFTPLRQGVEDYLKVLTTISRFS